MPCNAPIRLPSFPLNWRRWLLGSLFLFPLPVTTTQLAAADLFDLGEPYFETVGDKESLPLCCTALLQDKEGFIWIGTQSGLVRYDGYHFHRFVYSSEAPESLGGDYIRTLARGRDGRLWIGTASDGISVYDRRNGRFQHYRHRPGDPDSLSHDRVNAIVDTDRGTWIATNRGLDFLSAGSRKLRHFRHDPDDPNSLGHDLVSALLLDREGNLWIGTRNGLNLLPAGSNRLRRVSANPEQPGSLAGKNIGSLFQAADGKLWIGTVDHGGAWMDPADGSIHWIAPGQRHGSEPLHARIQAIVQPDPSQIWLGTYGSGILVLAADSGKVLRHLHHDLVDEYSINLDNIGALLVDESGLVWVGTWGGGLNRYNPGNRAFATLRYRLDSPDLLSHPDIGAILETDEGNIWIGTHGKGIDIIDPELGRIDVLRPDPDDPSALPSGEISTLLQASDGDIWIGTQQAGLVRFTPATRELTRFTKSDGLASHYVWDLIQDHDGLLWIATNDGLNLLDPDSNELQSLGNGPQPQTLLSGETVTRLALQENGTLWAGTTNGLYVKRKDAQTLEKISRQAGRPDSLNHDTIAGLLVDSKQRLWVDTKHGLNRLIGWKDGVARFQSINALIEQPGLYFGGNLLEDAQGRIWTQWFMLDPRTWTLDRLGRAEGADIGTPWVGSFAQTREGTLLYGGTNGLLMIRPDRYERWQYQPPLVISELRIDGETRPVGDQQALTLSPSVKSFSVEFAALDYSAAEKNRYAYRLQGYDQDWMDSDAKYRFASYTNLDPGDYTLHVRGSNRLGEWSPQQISLAITQLPSWYQTLWFRVLVLSLIALSLFAIVRLRLHHLKQQQYTLQQLVAQRTRDLQQALRDLEQVSLTDQLTGIHNRRFADQRIRNDLRTLERETHPEKRRQLGFIMIDIDHFKFINDHYGHEAGDRVLIQFSTILNRICRDSDAVIRWGGEEFLLIARYFQPAQLQALAERIRQEVARTRFELGNRKSIQRSCSLGISTYPFIDSQPAALTWEQTLNIADLALYVAKRNGRNAWVALYAGEVPDPADFYRQILAGLDAQIATGAVRFASSIRGDIDFKESAHPQH